MRMSQFNNCVGDPCQADMLTDMFMYVRNVRISTLTHCIRLCQKKQSPFELFIWVKVKAVYH